MQRLSLFPATPNLTLLNRRKSKPHPWSHATTTLQSRFTSDGVASTYRMHRVYREVSLRYAVGLRRYLGVSSSRGRCIDSSIRDSVTGPVPNFGSVWKAPHIGRSLDPRSD